MPQLDWLSVDLRPLIAETIPIGIAAPPRAERRFPSLQRQPEVFPSIRNRRLILILED